VEDYKRTLTTSQLPIWIHKVGNKEISLTTWWTRSNLLEEEIIHKEELIHIKTINHANKSLNFNLEACNSYNNKI